MATEKQIEANRQNAQRSTGPKTQEGKDKVRLNALTHGLRAAAFDVLPHEDRHEFAARLGAWYDDYEPTTAAQDQLVRQLAILSWKMDRADRYEITTMYERVHDAVKPCLDGPFTDSDSLNHVFVKDAAMASFDPGNEAERLRRYQFSLQRAFLRTLAALVKLRKEEGKSQSIGANQANCPAPMKANGEIGESGTCTRPTGESDQPRSTNRPGASFISPQKAPNKANSEPRTHVSSGSVTTRPVAPRLDLWPIEANSVGWLDISCEKS